MDEQEQAQNPVETESAEPADENSLDALFGGPPEVAPEPSTEPDKEEKKQRDFEKAFFKEKELRKAAEAKLKESSPPAAAVEPPEDQEGINLLKKVMGEVVDPYLAPLKEQQERAVVTEFKTKEYVDVLEPQIMAEYNSLTKTGDLAKDLELSRLLAIGKNIDIISKSALEVGQEAGFKNRTFKANQAPVREQPNLAGKGTDLHQKFLTGDLTEEEHRELRDDGTLETWEKQQLGIN